jgi:hypothetical protein
MERDHSLRRILTDRDSQACRAVDVSIKTVMLDLDSDGGGVAAGALILLAFLPDSA